MQFHATKNLGLDICYYRPCLMGKQIPGDNHSLKKTCIHNLWEMTMIAIYRKKMRFKSSMMKYVLLRSFPSIHCTNKDNVNKVFTNETYHFLKLKIPFGILHLKGKDHFLKAIKVFLNHSINKKNIYTFKLPINNTYYT